jgi:hypothetical protein
VCVCMRWAKGERPTLGFFSSSSSSSIRCHERSTLAFSIFVFLFFYLFPIFPPLPTFCVFGRLGK